jgi:hypothetical protein
VACVAYLLDRRTIRITVLPSEVKIADIELPAAERGLIEWLDLSPSATVLAIRCSSGAWTTRDYNFDFFF